MSSTATTTIVELFAAPPPTNNTLDPEQRSRLLRSTRKLGAVLGTTPLLLEPEPESDCVMTSEPTLVAPSAKSQSTRADRREGRIFHSPSSSISSEETLAISPESDYVFVRSNTRSAPYQVQAVFNNASPSSSRSASPHRGPTSRVGVTAPVSRNLKRKQGQDNALAPITIMFPIPGSAGSKQTRSGPSGSTMNKEKDKGKADVHPSQPLLLRLRAAPGQQDDRRIKADVHSNSPPQPLSPVSSTFNMNMSVDFIPYSPMPSRESSSNGLTDREKRRKMAKLTRTLGENIPPELVFRAPTFASSPSSGASSSNPPAHSSRRTSLSISRPHPRPSLTSIFDPLAPFHKPTKFSPPSKSNAAASVPPAPVNPPPTSAPSQLQSQSPPRENATKRRHRPRSLTLGSSSAFAAATASLLQRERDQTRGTTSLDVQPSQAKAVRQTLQPQPSPKPFAEVAQTGVQDQEKEKEKTHGASLSVEFGRRKEREWSGEWNLKDMEDVTKRLRGLKGR